VPAIVVLAVLAACCVAAGRALARARWPRRSPAAAILLWQALGLGWSLAAVGALIAFGAVDQRLGVAAGAVTQASSLVRALAAGAAGVLAVIRLAALTAGIFLLLLLCWVLVSASTRVLRGRQRQRALLSLLARGDPKVPGALVVDHPVAAAYCLPGLRSAIVISSGALELLDQAELAAVLAHERAHLRERHDLVLLPFTALLSAFAWSEVVREAHRAVALLVEMHADDRALRHRPARELATALLRIGAAGGSRAPAGALAARGEGVDCDVAARVTRLLRPAPGLPAAGLALVCAAAALAVILPAAVLAIPF
jgi:Zn-dependent protease with chaperone function